MDGPIYLVIAGTFFGFIALAFILLFPVYRFMRRQERMADDWTPEAVTRREREARRAQGEKTGQEEDRTAPGA